MKIWLLMMCMILSLPVLGQDERFLIRGTVTESTGKPLRGATVQVKGSNAGTITDQKGRFQLKLPAAGVYTLQITSVGYATLEHSAHTDQADRIHIKLQQVSHEVKTVEIQDRSALQKVEAQAYSVDALDVKALRERHTDLNRLLDAMPGIRVRETGGIGSESEYSIHGLSGKAVRFFLDGIPMESFGSTISIGNFPVHAIDRIEVYKGVTPISLGSDALGGAINIVTRKDMRNYLDLAYSYGSFETHRGALSTRLRKANGLTFIANATYNNTENNYKVWGNTIEIADEFGRPIPGNPGFRRFNDDFRSIAVKAEAGFTHTAWADQLLLGFTFSDLDKGIQTGRTMAYVYGDVRYQEAFIMPNIRYAKKYLFTKGLDLDVFAAINRVQGTTTDTGTSKYNWAGDVIANVTGELNGIRAQHSRFTFTDDTKMAIVNASYELRPAHTLRFNYTMNSTRRTGKDDIAQAEWTIPYLEPQQLARHISGFAYEAALLDNKWTNTFFVKNFHYTAQANVYDYNGSAQKEVYAVHNNENNWGFGYAGKLQAAENTLVKFSAESATRLPDASELLGNGNTIINAPGLQPERSFNLNANVQQMIRSHAWRINLEAGAFFRNVRDLIWLGDVDIRGTAQFRNEKHIRSAGLEASATYYHQQWLEISANGTWQDVRNKQRYLPSGAPNIVYNDKMKNMPSLMGNAEIRLRYPETIRKNDRLSGYINTHFVEQYFLNWPSMGGRDTKRVIPRQFIQDAGITYSMDDNRCSISIECRNLFNKQVYDNYLLQKPGRSGSIKLRYFLHNKQNER